MDKYNVIVKIEQIKECLNENKNDEALDIAAAIDPSKVKESYHLMILAKVFAANGMLAKAKSCYEKVYAKSRTRHVAMELANLSIRLKNVVEADHYLDEFRELAPDHYMRHVFKYKIDRLKGKSVPDLIESLEKLKKEEFFENWGFELAKLYNKNGDTAKCIATCNDVIIWFSEGEYVDRAKLLKAYLTGDRTEIGENENELIAIYGPDGTLSAKKLAKQQAEEKKAAQSGNVNDAKSENSGKEGQTKVITDEERAAIKEQADMAEGKTVVFKKVTDDMTAGKSGKKAGKDKAHNVLSAGTNNAAKEIPENVTAADTKKSSEKEPDMGADSYSEKAGTVKSEDFKANTGDKISEEKKFEEKNSDDTRSGKNSKGKKNQRKKDKLKKKYGNASEAKNEKVAEQQSATGEKDEGISQIKEDAAIAQNAERDAAGAAQNVGKSADSAVQSVEKVAVSMAQNVDEAEDTAQNMAATAGQSPESGAEAVIDEVDKAVREGLQDAIPVPGDNEEMGSAVAEALAGYEKAAAESTDDEEALIYKLLAEEDKRIAAEKAEEEARRAEKARRKDKENKKSEVFVKAEAKSEAAGETNTKTSEAVTENSEKESVEEKKSGFGGLLKKGVSDIKEFVGERKEAAAQKKAEGQKKDGEIERMATIREEEDIYEPRKPKCSTIFSGGVLDRFLKEKDASLEEYFAYFACNDDICVQLVQSLDVMLSDKKYLSFCLQCEKGSGKKAVINGMTRLLTDAGQLTSAKPVWADADGVNDIELEKKAPKLKGRCLAIDKAGKLNEKSVESIINLMKTGEMAVVLIDYGRNIKKLTKEYEELEELMLNKIEMPSFGAKELEEFADYKAATAELVYTTEAHEIIVKKIKAISKNAEEGVLAATEKYIAKIIDNTETRNAEALVKQALAGNELSRTDVITVADIPEE